MKHLATQDFWKFYKLLPQDIQELADKNFNLLKKNHLHPSLHFKKAGNYWSVRVGRKHRAIGIESDNDILWFWIGTHAQYDQILSK